MAKRNARRVPKSPVVSLAAVPLEALQKEVARRAAAMKGIERKRAHLARQLASLDARIAAAHGAAAPARMAAAATGSKQRRRASGPKAGGLVDVLLKVLAGGPKKVPAAAAAAKAAGYKSNAKSFSLIVNQVLLKRADLFKRVSRGTYAVK